MKELFARAKKFLAPKQKPLEAPHQPTFAPQRKEASGYSLKAMVFSVVIGSFIGIIIGSPIKSSIYQWEELKTQQAAIQSVQKAKYVPIITGYKTVQEQTLRPIDLFLDSFVSTKKVIQYEAFLRRALSEKQRSVQYTEFFKQLKDVDPFLQEKHADPGLQKRVDFCNRGIDLLKKIEDPLLRCRAIACLTSAFFAYSMDKASFSEKDLSSVRASYRNTSWTNSVQESLIGGDSNGVVCVDLATFAAYLAIKSGFSAADVSLLNMTCFDKKEKKNVGHTAVNIKTNKGSIIVDPWGAPSENLDVALSDIILFFSKIKTPSQFFSKDSGNSLQGSINMLGQTVLFEQDPEQKNVPPKEIKCTMNPHDFKHMLDIYACAAEAYVTRGGASLETTGHGKQAKEAIKDTRLFFASASNIKSLMHTIQCAREKRDVAVTKIHVNTKEQKKPSARSGRAGRHRADLRM